MIYATVLGQYQELIMKLKVLGISALLAFNSFAFASSCIDGMVQNMDEVKVEKMRASITLKNTIEEYNQFKENVGGIENLANFGKVGTFLGGWFVAGPVAVAPYLSSYVLSTGLTASAWSVIAISGVATVAQNIVSEVETKLYTSLFGSGPMIESYIVMADLMLNSKIKCEEGTEDYYKLLESLDSSLSEVYRIGEFDVHYFEALFTFAGDERLTIEALMKLREVKIKVLREFLNDIEMREKFLVEIEIENN
jgi:hypothetical protein